MAKNVGETVRWAIGLVFTAVALVYGSSLYDDYFRQRNLGYDVRASIPSAGNAVLRVFNKSPKPCGPVVMTFRGNATLLNPIIEYGEDADKVVCVGKRLQIKGSRLATANGHIDVRFDYRDLRDGSLKINSVEPEVGCGEWAYRVVDLDTTEPRPPKRGFWIIGGVLGVVAVLAIIAGVAFNPFRTWL